MSSKQAKAAPKGNNNNNKQNNNKNEAQKRKPEKETAKPPAKKEAKKAEELTPEQMQEIIVQVEKIQYELNQADYNLSLEMAKLEAAEAPKRNAIFAKRDKLLNRIPGFWKSMLIANENISAMMEEVDADIFDHLISVKAEDFFNEKRNDSEGNSKLVNGFKLTFEFEANDILVPTKIVKEIAIVSTPPKPPSQEEEDDDDQDKYESYIIKTTPNKNIFAKSDFEETQENSLFKALFGLNSNELEVKHLGELFREVYRNPLDDDEDDEEGDDDEFPEGDEGEGEADGNDDEEDQ